MGTNRIFVMLLLVACGVGSIEVPVSAQNQNLPTNHFYQAQRQFQSSLPSRMPEIRGIGYPRKRQDDPFGENQLPTTGNPPQEQVDKQDVPVKQPQSFDPFADPPQEDQATKQSPPPPTDQQDPFGEGQIEPRQPQTRQPQTRQPQTRQPQVRQPETRQPQAQPRPEQPNVDQNSSNVAPSNVPEYPPGAVRPETFEPQRRLPDATEPLPAPRQPAVRQPVIKQPQPRTYQEPQLNWDNSQPATPQAPNYSLQDNPSVQYPAQPMPNQQPYAQQPYAQQPYSQQPYPQPYAPQPFAPGHAEAGSIYDSSALQGLASQELLAPDMGCRDCGFECGAPMFYFSVFGGSSRLGDLVSSDQTSRIFTENGAGYGVAIGQRHGTNLRTELEYSRRTNDIIGRENQSVGQTVTGDVSSNAGMANVYWEMMNFPHRCFKPYVGAGLGFVSLEMDMFSVDGRNLIPQNATDDSSFAYQFIGGVNYKAYRNMDLFIEYRLFQADSYRVDSGSGFGDGKYDCQTDNLFAGLRWKF